MIDLTTITPPELLAMIAQARRLKDISSIHADYLESLEDEAFRRRIKLPEETK